MNQIVSIIIPVFNCQKFVKEAIQSALMQTYKEKEIIIIDDGSTDETVQITEKYARNLNVVHKENRGTASALNAGIKASRGDWIKWLSADDVLLPNAVSEMMKLVSGNDSIYYTDYYRINENGETIGLTVEPKRNGNTDLERNKELLSYFYGNGSTSLIHKSIFERCGYFDESLPHSEDYEYWLRCCLCYGVELTHIPIISLKYREHPDQLTKKYGGSLDSQIKTKILNSLPSEKRLLYG